MPSISTTSASVACSSWLEAIPPSIMRGYQDLYQTCIEEKIEPQSGDIEKIEKDIHRTFPVFDFSSNNHEGSSGEACQASIVECGDFKSCALLRQLLHAVCCYAPYVQGMNYIAAKLLIYCNTDDLSIPFVLFMFLYKECEVSGVYCGHGESLRGRIAVFEHHIRQHLNDLWHYFQHIEFACTAFTMEWLVTLFITTHPQSISSFAITQLLAGDGAAVYRIGIATLKHHERTLLSKSLDELQSGFRSLVRTSQSSEVLRLSELLVLDCDTKVKYIIHRKTSADRDAMTPHARCVVM